MIKRSGLVSFPDLRLQYFDVTSERMHVNNYRIDKYLALSPVIQWVLLIVLLVFFVWCFLKIKPFLQRLYIAIMLLKKGRQQLKQAQTAVEIRHSMKLLSQAFGWSANVSIRDWQAGWQQHVAGKAPIEQPLHELSRALYNKETGLPLDRIKTTLLTHRLSQLRMCLRYARLATMEHS